MRKLKIKTLLWFCLMALFVSCTDNDDQDCAEHQTKTSYAEQVNPFNEIGEVHNDLLQSFGLYAKKDLDAFVKNSEVGDNEMDEFLEKSLITLQSIISSQMSIANDSAAYIINESINMFNQCAILNQNDGLSKTIREQIDTANSIQDLIASISAIEADLVAKYSIDKSCESDLIAITVFKYSLNYWNTAFSDVANPWFNFLNATYENQTIAYVSSKGLFKDIWDKVKNAAHQVTTWVSNNWEHIATGVVIAALSDYSGARCAAFGFGNPIVIGLSAGVCSVIGGLTGWTDYSIIH